MRFSIFILSSLLIPILVSCQKMDTTSEEEAETTIEMFEEINTNEDEQAVVTAVSVSGSENNYNFSVTIQSPDTGCDQYADWWEVFNEEGELLYRRILSHSHVNEQPFTRSGGPVNIAKDTRVYIRAHMNNLGYGSILQAGTVEDGFDRELLRPDENAALETTAPLPKDCAF